MNWNIFVVALCLMVAPLFTGCTSSYSNDGPDQALVALGGGLDMEQMEKSTSMSGEADNVIKQLTGSNTTGRVNPAKGNDHVKSYKEKPLRDPRSMKPRDQYEMALINYRQGKYAEAVPLFRAAADKGLADAQYKLGNMYENGLGIKQDDAEAVNWYLKAAEQENDLAKTSLIKMGDQRVMDVEAQRYIGGMYRKGEGVEKNYVQAFQWYRKAAERGDAEAQLHTGFLYQVGRGTKQDYAEALRWYRKSAEKGNDLAQHNLGVVYFEGKGVKIDYAESLKWLSKSAEQGNEQAAERVRDVKKMQEKDALRREKFKEVQLTKDASGRAVVKGCDIRGLMYMNVTLEATPVMRGSERNEDRPVLYITFREDGSMKIADRESSKVVYEGRTSPYSPSSQSKAVGYDDGYVVYGVFCPLSDYHKNLDYKDWERYFAEKGKPYYYERRNSIYTLKRVPTLQDTRVERVGDVQRLSSQ